MGLSPFLLNCFPLIKNKIKRLSVFCLSKLSLCSTDGTGGYKSGGIAHGLCSRINLLSFQNLGYKRIPNEKPSLLSVCLGSVSHFHIFRLSVSLHLVDGCCPRPPRPPPSSRPLHVCLRGSQRTVPFEADVRRERPRGSKPPELLGPSIPSLLPVTEISS